MHYHVAELLIYEVGLSKSNSVSQSNGLGFQRLECLCSSLQAVKTFFDIFLAIPTPDYYMFSAPSVS